VTNEEKTSLKAACLQAATTLIAARDSMKGAVDLDECVKLAAELYAASRRQTGRRARRMKPFAPAILAEDRPECPPHVRRNESEKKCGPLCVPAGPYPSYASHPVENIRERLRSNYFRGPGFER
jgi:hypothetical protein